VQTYLLGLNAGRSIGADDGDPFGGYLFPIIEHYQDCLTCTKLNQEVYVGSTKKDLCNEVDLKYLLFFNGADPTTPYYTSFNNSNFYEYYDTSVFGDDGSGDPTTGRGFTGMIYINLYYGVEFLNEFFYELPEVQCSQPIAMAVLKKTTTATNSTYYADANDELACGSDKAAKLLKHKKMKSHDKCEKRLSVVSHTSPYLKPHPRWFLFRLLQTADFARGRVPGMQKQVV